MKVLNLYAGLGGNRKHWEGVTVTAVESDPKIAAVYSRLYPQDNVIVGDAHAYLLENSAQYQFIWSSIPCQSHSKLVKAGRNRTPRYPDMRLYEEILFLKHFYKGKWVVENVVPYYKPLIPAQRIGRHLFWCNFHIPVLRPIPELKNFINQGNNAAEKKFKEWLGIEYEERLFYNGNNDPAQVLRNCVHPDIGKHIFDNAFVPSVYALEFG